VRQLRPEGGERRWVVLPQIVAQLVDQPLPAPDQVLVGARQHLQRGGQLRVARHRPVVVPVGSHQVSENLGVPGIRLSPGRRMPIAVPTGRERIDRIDLVTRRQQGSNEQPPVGLDPDHHLVGLGDMVCQQRMELTHALEALRNPSLGEDRACHIQHADVVVRLRPIDADEDLHTAPPSNR
jgi:hypothetical protein